MLTKPCWVLTAIIAIASCGRAAPKPPEKEKEEEKTASTDPRVNVKLLEAGTPPLRKLRMTSVVGAHEEWILRLESSHSLAPRPDAKTAKKPAVTVVADLKLVELSKTGDRTYKFLIGTVPTTTASPNILAHGSFVASDRGLPQAYWVELGPPGQTSSFWEPTTTTFTGPVAIRNLPPTPEPGPGAPDVGEKARVTAEGAALLALHHHLIPFPVEAVGHGAKWRVTASIDEQGIRQTQTTDYEVIEINDEGLRLKATSAYALDGNTFTDPEYGVELRVERFEASGRREAEILLRHALPSSDQSTRSALSLQADADDEQEGPFSVTTEQTIRLAPLDKHSLLPFPPMLVSGLRTRWWQLNFCEGLRGERSGPFARGNLNGTCSDGKLNGVWTSKQPDGSHLRGEFAMGVAVGTWTQQAANGDLLGSFVMDDGTGTLRSWWPNGQIRFESLFRDGKPSGIFKSWFPDGSASLEGSFTDGERDAMWREWAQDGRLLEHVRFDHRCRIVNEITADSPAGETRLRLGDVIVAVDGTPIDELGGVGVVIRNAGARRVVLSIGRGDKKLSIPIVPRIKEEGGPALIGIKLSCQRAE